MANNRFQIRGNYMWDMNYRIRMGDIEEWNRFYRLLEAVNILAQEVEKLRYREKTIKGDKDED